MPWRGSGVYPPSVPPAARSTLVLLVRHGHTPTTGTLLPGQARGLHLADEGRRQAERVGRRIAGLPRVAAVYASPLERARETAAPIARAHRRPVRIEPGLSDTDVGAWTGQSLKRLRRRREWALVLRHPAGFRFPGGESFVGVQARVVAALARIVARHAGQTVVAVSHADPIKAAVSHALGAPLDLLQRIEISTGSVTAIAFRPTGPLVLTVNSTHGDLGALGLR